MSHRRTSCVQPASSCRPSALKATAATGEVWPRTGRQESSLEVVLERRVNRLARFRQRSARRARRRGN
jgi:hypothetical protein